MPAPSTPTNVNLQQGDGKVLITSDLMPAATGYPVQRSTDGVSFSLLGTALVPEYLDTTAAVGTLYYYQMAASNGSGTSAYSTAQKIVPAATGQFSLLELRTRAQQRADRVNSNFVTTAEWNAYLNASARELYDLLITSYEDYFVAPRLSITTDGTASFDLPTGQNYSSAPALYKLYGVDLGVSAAQDAWITLKKFDFIARNRYVFPQQGSTALGVNNLQYRVLGSKIQFIPTPSAGQTIGLWYFPRLTTLMRDYDILDGISGWEEYVVVDAAIKALRKEESDTQELMSEKMGLKQRIEEAAQGRDAGQPDTISDVRGSGPFWNPGMGNEPFGGF
jgi:hypothetical protein